MKTEEIKTDVEASTSIVSIFKRRIKYRQPSSILQNLYLNLLVKPNVSPRHAAKRINLPLIELSNLLKKTIKNHPDTKNTTHNTKIVPLNHTTPIDLSSFVLLDGDECQMKEIVAKVIPATIPPSNQHHPFRYYPKNRPPRVRQPRKPRQSKYPGDEWYSYLDLVSRITRE